MSLLTPKALIALVFPAIAWCPALARADDGAPPEIVVTGQGLALPPATPAYDVVTLDADQLRRAASGRIEDALAGVAGFQQFRRSDSRASNPSAQGVTLRALGGNATSRALVLLDGVPQADPFFGYVPLSALVPDHLAGVRVTRGGGAGAFGSGAVAGAIELASAGPDQLGRAEGVLSVDDRGETALSLAAAPRLGSGFAVVSGRWDRGSGFWTTPQAQRDALSVPARFASWSGAIRAVAPLAPDVELQARVAAFDDRRTLRFAGADSLSRGQDASLRLVARGAWQVEALAYVQARDFANVTLSANPALRFRKTLDQYATPSTGLGGKLEVRPPLGQDHVLRLGVDWRDSRGTGAEAAYSTSTGLVTARRSAGGHNSDLGLYAEHDWTLGPLMMTVGGRADRWAIADGTFVQTDATGTQSRAYPRRTGWDGNGRAGLLLRADRALSLRAAAYTGTRLPTLNELYRSFTVVAVRTAANEALTSERLEGVEAGLDLTPLPGLSFTATAFANRVRHAIANVPDPADRNSRKRRNIDGIVARGVELGADLRQGPFALEASAAFTSARLRASGPSILLDGMRPAQTPRLATSATLAWAPRAEARVALTLRHTGAQYEDDLQTDRLAPATTLDGFVQWPLRPGLTMVLRAENIADVAVVTRNQAGSIDLGAPRTVWFGLRARLP